MIHIRPYRCSICFKPLKHARTGRPRKTCSDACRQKLCRTSDHDYGPADRELARLEKVYGPYDDTRGPNGSPSLHWRVRFYLDRGIQMPDCRCCGRPFPRTPHDDFGPHICSRPCKNAMERRKRAFHRAFEINRLGLLISEAAYDRIRREQPVLFCAHCSIPFVKEDKRGRQPKYCSLKCRQAAYYRRSHPPILFRARCPGCAKRFPVRHPHQKYCSRPCGARYDKRVRQARLKEARFDPFMVGQTIVGNPDRVPVV